MECVPTVSPEVLKVATPALNATEEPRFPAPSLNCTVPVGELPLTVAVKVIDCPNADGFNDEPRLVVVEPGPTEPPEQLPADDTGFDQLVTWPSFVTLVKPSCPAAPKAMTWLKPLMNQSVTAVTPTIFVKVGVVNGLLKSDQSIVPA